MAIKPFLRPTDFMYAILTVGKFLTNKMHWKYMQHFWTLKTFNVPLLIWVT